MSAIEGEKVLREMTSVHKGGEGSPLLLPSLECLCVTGKKSWWDFPKPKLVQMIETKQLKADSMPMFENHKHLFLVGKGTGDSYSSMAGS